MRIFTASAALLTFACLLTPLSAWAQAEEADVGLCAGPGLDLEPVAQVTEDRALRVVRFEPAGDGVTYVLRATVYTCDSCQNGTCYPTWNGHDAGCTSATCNACTLNADGDPVEKMADPGDGGCGEPIGEETLARIEARTAAIEDYTASRRLPAPSYDENGEAKAPEGFELAVEEIDGVALAYVVPIGDPGPDGAPLRLYVNKAKCGCSGSGKCSWSGIICSGSNCDDGCEITVKGDSHH